MARTPQSFEKRQRERRKQMKREEKLERRLIRSEEKRLASQGLTAPSEDSPDAEGGEGSERGEQERTPSEE